MQLVQVRDPDEPAVRAVAELLLEVFADPNTVLGEDRLREFLAESGPERRFAILTLVDHGTLAGVTVFSYVPRSNCGFSEYLVVRAGQRGRGLGRMLFDGRKARLDAAARSAGFAGCNGLFIEADNPERTPADVLEAERKTALDAHERLRIFAHLGFFRVNVRYVQPPLGPGKAAVDYLDLLFAPFLGPLRDLPAGWVVDTVGAVWRAWAGGASPAPRVSSEQVELLPLQASV